MRGLHSERDEAIPIAAARVAVIYQKMIGNEEGQAFEAGPNADHRSGYLYSLVNLKPRLDGLRQGTIVRGRRRWRRPGASSA